MVATQGELFLDLSKYLAIDGVILTLFAVVAMIISKLVCNSKRFGIYLFVYYYFLFAVFSDGHVAGWSHSATIFDKLAVSLFIVSPLLLLTVWIPIVIFVLAFLQSKGMKFLCQKV